MTKKLLSIDEVNDNKQIAEFLEKVLTGSLKKGSQDAALYLSNQKKTNLIKQHELAYKYSAKMKLGNFFYTPAILLAIELQKAAWEKHHILSVVLIAYKKKNITEAVRLLKHALCCACKEKNHVLRAVSEKLPEALKHIAVIENVSNLNNSCDEQVEASMGITQILNKAKYERVETALDDGGIKNYLSNEKNSKLGLISDIYNKLTPETKEKLNKLQELESQKNKFLESVIFSPIFPRDQREESVRTKNKNFCQNGKKPNSEVINFLSEKYNEWGSDSKMKKQHNKEFWYYLKNNFSGKEKENKYGYIAEMSGWGVEATWSFHGTEGDFIQYGKKHFQNLMTKV